MTTVVGVPSEENVCASTSAEEVGDMDAMPKKGGSPPMSDVADSFSGNHSTEEAPASMPRTVCAMVGTIIPAGGLLSAGFNLASTSIGAGILGLPSAFKSVGILMAAFYLLLVTAETVYSMVLLVWCAEKTGLRTFESMARHLVHPKGAFFVGVIRFIHAFGACVAYVVTVGDLVRPILENASGAPEFLTSTNGIRLMQTLMWLLFFLPLSIPRRINSLRYVSAFGLLFILFFCLCIMVHSGTNGLQQNPRPKTKLANTGNDAVQGLGVFIFSYMCQVNCVEIYMELTKRNVRQFTICAAISMTICGTLYFLTGLFGYLDFGSALDGSILNEFNPVEEPTMLVSYIGIFVKICASYGLLGHVCRSVVYQLLGWEEHEVSFLRHLCVVFGVAVGSLLCGIFIPDINIVFGFIGGFCGGFIAFILPALFIMYSGGWTVKSVGWIHFISTYLVLMAGVLAIVFGTGSTIYSACT